SDHLAQPRAPGGPGPGAGHPGPGAAGGAARCTGHYPGPDGPVAALGALRRGSPGLLENRNDYRDEEMRGPASPAARQGAAMTQVSLTEEIDLYVWEGASDIAARAERALDGYD